MKLNHTAGNHMPRHENNRKRSRFGIPEDRMNSNIRGTSNLITLVQCMHKQRRNGCSGLGTCLVLYDCDVPFNGLRHVSMLDVATETTNMTAGTTLNQSQCHFDHSVYF